MEHFLRFKKSGLLLKTDKAMSFAFNQMYKLSVFKIWKFVFSRARKILCWNCSFPQMTVFSIQILERFLSANPCTIMANGLCNLTLF